MNGPFWLWEVGDFIQPRDMVRAPKYLCEDHVYRVEQAKGPNPRTQMVRLRGWRVTPRRGWFPSAAFRRPRHRGYV